MGSMGRSRLVPSPSQVMQANMANRHLQSIHSMAQQCLIITTDAGHTHTHSGMVANNSTNRKKKNPLREKSMSQAHQKGMKSVSRKIST